MGEWMDGWVKLGESDEVARGEWRCGWGVEMCLS